jgi:hypothetical protein
MTTEQALLQRIDTLQHTVAALVQAIGPRLTREQLCQRRGIHRNTLPRGHPRQYEPGKWTWVQPHARGNRAHGVVQKDYSAGQALLSAAL